MGGILLYGLTLRKFWGGFPCLCKEGNAEVWMYSADKSPICRFIKCILDIVEILAVTA